MKERVLITGAGGQIGTELVLHLRQKGVDVLAAGHRKPLPEEVVDSGPVCCLDVRDEKAVDSLIDREGIRTIYHLAGVLSAVAEKSPQLAWQVNVDGLRNILETAVKYDCSVFFPSSIGAFGPQAPPDKTPQVTIQRPTTIYGISKVCGEMLCDYYFQRFGLDTRGLRFPGLISHKVLPGGGTTDYAVDIFLAAVQNKSYECYLRKGTFLDMMYMPDALKAAVELMEADPNRLRHRNAYNITAMSFSPEQIYAEIKKHIPGFVMKYQVDPVRQKIADSWPNSLDDSTARDEWGWKPDYDLAAMTGDMLDHLQQF